MNFEIRQGDALQVLKQMPDESVNCCVTSPPYFGLRDYQVEGQMGFERTPDEYVSLMVERFRHVRRVLRNDATCWLNVGDSYWSTNKRGRWGSGNSVKHAVGTTRPLDPGIKPKDLIGIPWMLAFALRADGWYLRSEIIWAKRNCMPESVGDRPTRAHEQIFLLTKSASYHYDADAIREPFSTDPRENYPERARITGRGDQAFAVARGNDRGKSGGFPPASHGGSSFHKGKTATHQLGRASERERHDSPLGRNKRSVWTVATCPTPEAHFATFPVDLVEPCILAGCPEYGVVLDPFSGAGTTGLACLRTGRKYIGIEINQEYINISYERARKYYPLLVGDAA